MRYGKLNAQLNRCLVVLSAGLVTFLNGASWAEPELNVISGKQPARLNRVFRVTYEVSWEGAPDDYVVMPAEFDDIDWGGVNLSEIQATVRNGVNAVSQTVELTPRESGEFEMPGVRIAYLSPENLAPSTESGPPTHPTAPEASPQLRAEPFALLVRPDRTLTWLFGALGALFLSSVVVVWLYRRRVNEELVVAPAGGGAADMGEVETALQSARRCRIDGDPYGYYCQLAHAATALGLDEYDRPAKLNAIAKDIGYRGTRPTDDQMDSDLRALERELNRRKEETEQ